MSGNGRWVRGLRGATTAEANTPEAIESATVELLQALFEANDLDVDDIASILFSVTDDLDAAFPARGARLMGLNRIPLFCVREIPVPGSCPLCIRVLMHVNTDRSQAEMVPVYLREARSLRPDLEGGTAVAATESHRPVKRETIMRITPYVPGKPAEEVKEELGLDDVIKLASNESPIGPSPRAVEAVSRDLANLHVYPDGAIRALRGALSERLGVPADQIVVGNGSDEVIKLLAEAYFSAGDEIIFAQPTFGEYAYVARLMGAQERAVPTRDMVLDLDAMAAAVGPRTKAVFVCNPNNPTGTYVDREAVDRFLDRIPEHVIVVFDEAYVEYVDADDFPDTVRYVREGRPVVVLRTFSKIYGLAALRVGYGVGPADIMANVARVKEPFNVNRPAQVAALAALDDEEHVQRALQVNGEGKAYLTEELTRLGVRVWPSQANFLWMDVGEDARRVFQELLTHGVIVRTGDIFGFPTFLRVTVGTGDQNERFVRALEQVLATMRGAEAPGRASS